uniref:non-specific serine/threonine protein kinase n=1 Tax=Oryza meridionalis TaxID=40149 RepID=A0A0E0DPN8_9ORYZ
MVKRRLFLLLFLCCLAGSRIASADTNTQDAGGSLMILVRDGMELSAIRTQGNLFGMNLKGTLSDDIGSLTELRILDLSSNKDLGGTLPATIGKLVQLEIFALNSNQFTGIIPPSLGKLSKVTWLDLADNQLTGPIPNSRDHGAGFDQLLKAQHFHLNQNKLQGSVPDYLFNSSMELKHILFDRNNFSGSIPASIGVLSKLEVLRLNDNAFTGQVPAMNNLTMLHVLTMQSVSLSGQLPQKLFSFPDLQHVILSDNQLNETLDMGNNVSKQLNLVDIQNNKIASVTLYNNLKGNILKLAGNPLCNDSVLSSTTPCTGQLSEYPTQSRLPPDVQCANPFVETIVFRAPSFGDAANYLYVLHYNLSSKLNSCTPNNLGLVYSNDDAYLNVDIKACPVNQKRFNYSQVLNCFNLTLQTYKPPEIFGPYYVKAHPYPFHDKASRTVLIGVVTGSFLLVIGLTLVGVYAVRQKKRAQKLVSINDPFASWGSMGQDIGEAPKINSARCFTLEDLKLSTNDFREINAIGAGGYGTVYRGKLPDGQLIAIKRSKQGSMQGGLEFKTEIELLSRVHHKNLVGLVGFCFEKGERMLVYEFIPNGTLSEALYGIKGVQLDWSRRLKIALDSARGLAYLHDHANPPIIHRDVKSTNILLGERMTAKVADFGLSLLVSDSEEGQFCTNIKGTLGYLDPEYYMTQQLTAKSDVYSFGVVLLELIVAQPPIYKQKYIVREVKTALDMGDQMYCGLKDVMDPVLQKTGDLRGFARFLKLALQCVEDLGTDRPSMNTIVREIEVIMQDNGIRTGMSSTSSSFSIDSRTMMAVPKYPYSNASTSSTAFDMDSRAFEYSGKFPSEGSLKNRGT